MPTERSEEARPIGVSAERTRSRRRGPIRSYVVALKPNTGKAEEARYAIWWATRFCLDYVHRLHHLPANIAVSTAGRGELDHGALKRAKDMLRAGRAAERATGERFEKPQTVAVCADALLSQRPGTTFPLWVKVSCGPHLPAVPHRALSRALRAGGTLVEHCELRHGKTGGLVARIFVEHPRVEPTPSRDYIGADVGVNVGVTTSDGRHSHSLRPLLVRARVKRAAQQRQHHHRSSTRTAVKQLLDREARRLVMFTKRGNKGIAIESLKTLGQLKPSGIIGGWARRHFGERVLQIGELNGVAVTQVHPAYTSQTCVTCDHMDPKNRRGESFRCTFCGVALHADVVGARNIARKARGAFPWDAQGSRKNTVALSGSPSSVGVNS